MGGLRRLYKLSLLSGLILASPVLLGTGWYAWSAYAGVDRFRRELDRKATVDLELLQLAVHDELRRDLARIRDLDRPERGRIPTISIALPRESVEALERSLEGGRGPAGPDGAKPGPVYVKCFVEKDGKVHDARLRYRGEKAWHVLAEQKSMEVKLEKGDLIDGVRAFNLLNDPTPFGLEDQLILDVARELGLLSPEFHPVRVRVNNHDMGVYRFEAQADESLVRRGRRVPGAIYSGDTEEVDPGTGAGALFSSTRGWKKVASRTEAEAADLSELERMISSVGQGSHEAFARYARAEIDLDRYALFDALDVVFGGREHDYFTNHKLYVDPYRGRWEPIAWSFRGFDHEEVFDRVDHPLLIRLKMTPGFRPLRNRKVYELLTQAASAPSIRGRAERLAAQLLPELEADPRWDAYKLLPRVTRLHRFLPRPMSPDHFALAAAWELSRFDERARYLLDALEEPGLAAVRTEAIEAPPGLFTSRLELEVRGHAAYRLEQVRAFGPCSGEVTLRAGEPRAGARSEGGERILARAPLGEALLPAAHHELEAGIELVPNPDPDPKRGPVRAVEVPTRYPYVLTARGCAPARVIAVLRSRVNGGTTRLELRAGALEPTGSAGEPSAGDLPVLAPGARSAHPWAFPADPPPARVELGPGRVRFDQTRIFREGEEVSISAGTTLELGPEVSLVFHGPVRAAGTTSRPILVRRADPEAPFGGLALQGPGTRGSRLAGLDVEGGSRPRRSSVEYTALVNLHDTGDVELSEWTVRGGDSEDVLHAYAVAGLRVSDLVVEGARTDGVDLEFVEGEVSGLRVSGAGDDCLDLMGARLRLHDAILGGCTNNAVSAGEETDLAANGVIVTGAKTGVLAKNASEVRLIRSLIHGTERALRARRKEVRYGGPSRIGTSDVFVLEAGLVFDSDRGSTIERGGVRVDSPDDRELESLLMRVLNLSEWPGVEEALGRMVARGRG